jgi:hypothetical protein
VVLKLLLLSLLESAVPRGASDKEEEEYRDGWWEPPKKWTEDDKVVEGR